MVVYIFRLPFIFTKVNKKIKKREEAEPHGHALATRASRGVKRTNRKKFSVKKRRATHA